MLFMSDSDDSDKLRINVNFVEDAKFSDPQLPLCNRVHTQALAIIYMSR